VNILLAVLLVPSLFWPKGPDTLPVLQKAGITEIAVPRRTASAWKSHPEIQVREVNLAEFLKIPTPSVNFRISNASATREPWVDSNGWRFLRQPDGHFYENAPGKSVALAAAEAYVYRAHVLIETDEAGLTAFATMLRFLSSLGENDLPPRCNFEYVDDGSSASGEFMNLLIRSNLLFKIEKSQESGKDITVALGSPQYPASEAGNPKLLAEKVRANVTDEKRLLRIYGSYLVIGRLAGDTSHSRLFLLNYGAERGDVHGVRVRILGRFPRQTFQQSPSPGVKLLDYATAKDATEFTIPDLTTLAVVDLRN
jgi:hypothetical protein